MELRGGSVAVLQQSHAIPTDIDELDESEQDILEISESVTAAENIHELRAEIEILKDLQVQAKELVDAGQDRKWVELHKLVTQDELLKRSDGSWRKLIVFSEFRATLDYLVKRLEGTLGVGSIVQIHGGTY